MRTFDLTKADKKDIYKRHLRTVGQRFYHYEDPSAKFSESVNDQSRLDEHLRKMRTAVLCRLALHLGLSADEHRVQEWVKLYDDAGVWRRIEQSQARSWRHFLRLSWVWRAH